MSSVNQYDPVNIAIMELIYGEGYLSMGGDAEVAAILGIDRIDNLAVLDLGCGLGGAAIALARNHHARRVDAIDIDAVVLERARILVDQAGLLDRIKLLRFQPGRLPFADHSFDRVFVTAVSCHVEELVPFFSEIRRVIRPGGYLLGGEWFKDNDNQAFRNWDELLRKRGLNFYFVSSEHYQAALQESGFEDVGIVHRNREMSELAQYYQQRSETELQLELNDTLGDSGYQALLHWTRTRAASLTKNGAGYGHFRAGNPLG